MSSLTPQLAARPRETSPRLHGVMVTFRRGHIIAESLRRVLAQSYPPTTLLVVDNEPTPDTRDLVTSVAADFPATDTQYVASPENVGPAGGWALGMQRLLEAGWLADWVVTLDDNNPPEQDNELEVLFHFAVAERRRDPMLAGVGVIGARFDWRRGMIVRVPDDDLVGPVRVDYLGGGFLSMYSLEVLRETGGFDPRLFFGSVELELGLRIRRRGYTLLAHGPLWRSRRALWDRLNTQPRPSLTCKVHWQKYYRIRNYIAMMRSFGRTDLAIRWAAIQCVAKPAMTLLRSPRQAMYGFLQAARATRDGFRGHLGRTVEPAAGPPTRD